MLEFNPYFRLSAAECLRHKMFDYIRNPQLEQGSPIVLNFDFDKEFNLNDQTDEDNYTENLDKYIKIINSEIKQV